MGGLLVVEDEGVQLYEILFIPVDATFPQDLQIEVVVRPVSSENDLGEGRDELILGGKVLFPALYSDGDGPLNIF